MPIDFATTTAHGIMNHWTGERRNVGDLRGSGLNISAAMRSMREALETVISGRARYEAGLHDAGWEEGLITVVGRGVSAVAARAGADAIEWLLRWPASAFEASDFLSYALPALRPRAALILINQTGEDEVIAEITARAYRQAARILLLTANPTGPPGKSARAIVPLPIPRPDDEPLTTSVIEHTALALLAAEAAKIFNPRNPHLEKLQLDALPGYLADVEIHLSEPIRALALRASDCRLRLAGGRFYYPAALEAASLARRIAAPAVEALTLAQAGEFAPDALGPEDGLLLMPGARNRADAVALAARLKRARLFALTSAADQELTSRCELSLLRPDIPDLPASLLSLIVLTRLTLERAHLKAGTAAPQRS